MRFQIALTVLVVVLGIADGVKLERYLHRDDYGSRFARLFHHSEPGWFDWMHRE